MAEHSTLTDPELHEPKGVAAAASGEVYVANGAASGVWTQQKGYFAITHHIEDISVAGNHYIPIPKAGTVINVVSIIEGALTTADLVLTVYNSAAASMGTITVTQIGSAAGDVDALAPASNNTVTLNDYVRVNANGGPASHVATAVTVLVEYDI